MPPGFHRRLGQMTRSGGRDPRGRPDNHRSSREYRHDPASTGYLGHYEAGQQTPIMLQVYNSIIPSLMGSRCGWSLGIALVDIVWRPRLLLRSVIGGIGASSCVPRARRIAGCVLHLLLLHLRHGRLALSLMLGRLLPTPTATFSPGSVTVGIRSMRHDGAS